MKIQVNIYKRQMQELGLNVKQYAELLEMPYEVVKNIIYDKEGDYSMEIGNLLRKNMFDKHQVIENNLENAKIKASEIKINDNIRKWYDEEYTEEMLNIKGKKISAFTFDDYFKLTVKGKEVSRTTIWIILSKNNQLSHLSNDTINEIAEQLYDILVNRNEEKYLKKAKEKHYTYGIKNVNKYLEWYRDFDVNEFMQKNDLSNKELAKVFGIGYSTMCKLSAKSGVNGIPTIKKLYEFVKNKEKEIIDNVVDEKQEEDTLIEEVIDNKEETQEMTTNNDELLKKILINRLTDEEKMLIELFGGKIC